MTTRFPLSVSDSSRPFFSASGPEGPAGSNAISVFPSTPIVPIPCDNDGSNPVYTSATTTVLIYIAGVLQTGWTLAYVSGSNCSGSVNNTVEPRTATISAVTALSGYAQFTATKNDVVLYFRLYFSKVPEGATGPTGSTGATGATGAAGATGATGAAGTGVVITHQTITVEAGVVVTKQDYGDGWLQINYPSAHNLEAGDFVHVQQSGVYDQPYNVLEVVDSDSVKLGVTYNATAGTVYAFSTFNLRAVTSTQLQVVVLKDIIPFGAKVLEFQFVYKNNSSGNIATFTVRLGDSVYVNISNINPNWLNSSYMTNEGDIHARDRRSVVEMNVGAAKNLYLSITKGLANTWDDAYMANLELEFFLTYINYEPDYTP